MTSWQLQSKWQQVQRKGVSWRNKTKSIRRRRKRVSSPRQTTRRQPSTAGRDPRLCSQQRNHEHLARNWHLRGIYENLDHKFLVRGHTFLENDTDFAKIEKRKSKTVVYLPEDWSRVIKETNLKNPFAVRKRRGTTLKTGKSTWNQSID